jgi:hypothetical protein
MVATKHNLLLSYKDGQHDEMVREEHIVTSMVCDHSSALVLAISM